MNNLPVCRAATQYDFFNIIKQLLVISDVAVLILLFISTWKDEEYEEYEANQEEDTRGTRIEKEEDATTEASQVCDTEEVNKTWNSHWNFTDFWIYSYNNGYKIIVMALLLIVFFKSIISCFFIIWNSYIFMEQVKYEGMEIFVFENNILFNKKLE